MPAPRSRTISRRCLLAAGWTLAAAPLVAACQQPSGAAQPTPQAIEKVVTQVVERVVTVTPAAAAPTAAKVVQLKLSTDWNALARKDVMDAAKKEYERLNPNVKVEHWHLGAGGTSGPGGMTDIVVAQLLTGTAADVIGEMAWQFHAEQFTEIESVLRSIGWKEDDHFLTPKTGIDLYLNGKQYAVPYNSVLTCYFCNLDLFEKAGVKPPTEAWTFDDELALGRTLTKADQGVYGYFARDYMDWGWGDHIWAEGAGVYSDDGKRLAFCDGNGPDRFQWYVDLIYKHGISPGPAEATKMLSPGITEPFTTGKIGLVAGQSGLVGPYIRQIGDRFKWALIPTAKSPMSNKRAHMFNQGGLAVPKLTKDRGTYDEAVKYAAFYNGDFVQKMYAELRPSMPSAKKWVQSEAYTKAPPMNLGQIFKNLSNDGGDHILINVRKGSKPMGEYNEAQQIARRHFSTAFNAETAGRAKAIFLEGCDKGSAILANIK